MKVIRRQRRLTMGGVALLQGSEMELIVGLVRPRVPGLVGQELAASNQFVSEPACIVVDGPPIFGKGRCEVESYVLGEGAGLSVCFWYPVPSLIAGDFEIFGAGQDRNEHE
jgi:hypothetical protein